MKLRIVGSATALFAVLVPAARLSHAAATSRLQVRATVLPWVSVTATRQVAGYQVSSADLTRGYVDLPGAVTLTVRSNVAREIIIAIQSGGAERVALREHGRAQFSESFIAIDPEPSRGGSPVSRTLDARIILSGDAREGIYPLEIALTPVL